MNRPKLKETRITEVDLREYLETADDFRLEMDIYRCCEDAGVFAEHGGSYKDPVTSKDRQFDIRAYYLKNDCVLRMAIECKNLNVHFPLLVSRMPRALSEAYHDIVLSVRGSAGPVFKTIRLTDSDSFFLESDFVGKSTSQVGRKESSGEIIGDDSEAHEKWSQAIASASELVKLARNDYRVVTSGPNSAALSATLPVLVVPDATLWAVDYSFDGKMEKGPRQLDCCTLHLGREVMIQKWTYRFSNLLIFTKSGFQEFLNGIDDLAFWTRLFPESIADNKRELVEAAGIPNLPPH